jgi:hypothetical protein
MAGAVVGAGCCARETGAIDSNAMTTDIKIADRNGWWGKFRIVPDPFARADEVVTRIPILGDGQTGGNRSNFGQESVLDSRRI